MQSQRQYFSRLGTAFLRRSANSQRLSHGPIYSFPGLVPNICRYLRIQTATLRNDRATQIEDITRPSVYRPSKIRVLRSPQPICLVKDGLLQKKPSDSSGVLKYSPINAFPVLSPTFSVRKTRAKPGKDTAQARWLSQRPRNEERTTEVSSPACREDATYDGEVPCHDSPQESDATGVVQQGLRPRKVFELKRRRVGKAKRQRTRRQRTRRQTAVWKHLEMAEEELEISGWQLGVVGRQVETWRQPDEAEKQLNISGGQLELLGGRIETWRQLVMAEKQQEYTGLQLEMAGRRIELWRQLDMVEQELCIVEIQLYILDRRIEAWNQIEIAERQLEIVGRQLEMVGRRVDLIRKAWKVADDSGLDVRDVPTLIDGASDEAENLREGGTEAQSEDSIQGVSTLIMRKLGFPSLRSRRWPRGQRRFRETNIRRPMGQTNRQRAGTGRPLSTPSGLLAHWLDSKDISEREKYWLKNRGYHRLSSLPLMLVVYLRQSANPDLPLDTIDRTRLKASTATLRRRGLNVKDIAEWAWILSAQDTKTMIARFTSTASRKPTFVLLEILRRDILDVRSLKLLLIYSWDQLQGQSGANLTTQSEGEVESITPRSRTTPSLVNLTLPAIRPLKLEVTSFILLLRRLLYHARRLWPPAIVSISRMVLPFIDRQLGTGSSEPRKLNNLTHLRLCKVFNQILRTLALPASINPYKSMVHNWQAQRVLLEMTTRFQPRLVLDRNSYRAAAQVLAASKKSERESRAATLRTRSWPPWRVEQDGMDAKRSPEDDLSRVIGIATQAKESGYSETVRDRAVRVLGGQEPDGTPTIPTRKLLLHRLRKGKAGRLAEEQEAHLWTARIESTRDVQEAWSAFSGYQEKGGKPTMSMYFAMIAKLQFEGARTGRLPQHSISPGDGKEVLQPSNDNFSSFYQARLQPPNAHELYRQMRDADIQPSGRFLTFLIQHARTPSQARNFMADAGISHEQTAVLKGTRAIPPDFLNNLSKRIFTAYVTLLCRFAPRAILVPPHEKPGAERVDFPTKSEWKIHEVRFHNRRQRGLDIFRHTAELLKITQSRSRPAWYAFFGALARRDAVVDRSLVGHPKNDILAWKVLTAALNDFHRGGLELDPQGFHILCNGLEKAILASFKILKEEREDLFGSSQICIVVDEFMKLSEADTSPHPMIPPLLHPIEGAHLHSYVRVLGLGEDYDGLMYVLRWMLQHHVVLEEIATQSQNGSKLIRRTIVAIKVFLGRTGHEAEAEELVNRVEHWGGWPQDFEAEEYINRGSGWSNGDDSEP